MFPLKNSENKHFSFNQQWKNGITRVLFGCCFWFGFEKKTLVWGRCFGKQQLKKEKLTFWSFKKKLMILANKHFVTKQGKQKNIENCLWQGKIRHKTSFSMDGKTNVGNKKRRCSLLGKLIWLQKSLFEPYIRKP